MISSFNQNASPKAHVMQAAAKAIKAEQAADAAALDFPWDVTSPEGLIAFFGEKLKQTNTQLKGLMMAQENRSKLIKDVGLMVGMLVADKDLKPGSPNWPEFQRLAKLVGPSLGNSDDAMAIRATLEGATAPGNAEQAFAFGDQKGVDAFLAAHPGAKITSVDPMVQTITWTSTGDGPGVGLDAASAKELGAKLKSLSENFQSENQMDSIRVQELVGRISQIMSLASNILHKFDEAAMAPIANTK